jgi:uncharacterized protein (DUF1501 family)
MNRREILRTGIAALSTASISTRLLATASSGPRFLLVFLRGGYDCANLLIPYSSSFYYESRPKIAIAPPDESVSINSAPSDSAPGDAAKAASPPSTSASPAGALALDSNWALAPAVRESIGPLYSQGQVAFIPFAGTDDVSRSHFLTQDAIELGAAGVSGKRDYGSGFLARLSTLLTGAAPISFTAGLPLAFKGRTGVPNLEPKGSAGSVLDERQASLLEEMYAGNPLRSAISDGVQLRRVAGSIESEIRAADRGAMDPTALEFEATRMAYFMRERYRLGFVDIGGWDTHVNEGGAEGALASSLNTLGHGLQTFAKAMGPYWKDTVVVVVSEFGRTFRENGNRGTDHGHGSVYWVLGGSISGGRVAGEQQRVAHDTLFQDRDFPVLNDNRAILGGLFRRMWDLSPDQLERVFPNAAPADLKLA